MIAVTVAGIGDEARPVSIGVLRHQQSVGLAGHRRSSECAVDVHRSRPRRPGTKRSPAADEIGSHWSSWQDVRLRKHEGSSSSQEFNSGVYNRGRSSEDILLPEWLIATCTPLPVWCYALVTSAILERVMFRSRVRLCDILGR